MSMNANWETHDYDRYKPSSTKSNLTCNHTHERFRASSIVRSGAEVWDVHGRRYLDFLAGAGSLSYGHNNPLMKKALIDYISRDGITHSLDLHTSAKKRFPRSDAGHRAQAARTGLRGSVPRSDGHECGRGGAEDCAQRSPVAQTSSASPMAFTACPPVRSQPPATGTTAVSPAFLFMGRR